MLHDKPLSLKESIKLSIEKKAKELAWDSLTAKEQKALNKKAEEIVMKGLQELAVKCVKEAEEAFNAPGFVSRADPSVYAPVKKKK